ncbi:DNA polymerase III subunit beta [Catenovulum sp. 2E275]|uniref:DNA polymerase III subunit beta n=1 Tax=Catenovulum sp. 2E275 TaxID=2980497 RepID=UPI0021CFEBAA|nr:DNA polymerase III subunit beta [Catenovulum sp. 2E275]MCU4675814.1 DNA polymerase III subunit beta [Catenovulum sp. 2E275]
MKFSVSREDILKPLQLATGTVERRHTLPILSNVLLDISDGVLSLTGTDLEVELIASVELVQASDDGKITVPAKKLFDICKGLNDSALIEFTLEDDKLRIRSGRSKYSLSTLPAKDFPNLEEWQSEINFAIKQSDFKRMIDNTSFSMANQDVRYYLNGMSLETSGNQIRCVTTDGHRLALTRVDLEETLEESQVIIPRKGVTEISRLIEDSDDNVYISIGSNHIRLSSSGFTFTSKLVDGRFPDYRRVLPKGGDKEIVADKSVIKQAFTRAAILSNEKFRGVRLNLSSGELTITATNPEQEVAEEVVEINYQGDDLEIGFNVAYMIDVLNVLESDEVKFTLGDSNSSALIEDNLDDRSVYVVMPMRL